MSIHWCLSVRHCRRVSTRDCTYLYVVPQKSRAESLSDSRDRQARKLGKPEDRQKIGPANGRTAE